MNVFDLISSQPLILISLGAVAIPLLLAVLLWVVNTVRRMLKKRQKQARLRAMMEAAAAAQAAEEAELAAIAKAEARAAAKAARAAAAAQASGGTAAAANGANGQPAQPSADGSTPAAPAEGQPADGTAAPAADGTQPEATAENASGKPGDDISSLLSDVFVDSESTARLEVLLDGMPNVDINDLQALTGDLLKKLKQAEEDYA